MQSARDLPAPTGVRQYPMKSLLLVLSKHEWTESVKCCQAVKIDVAWVGKQNYVSAPNQGSTTRTYKHESSFIIHTNRFPLLPAFPFFVSPPFCPLRPLNPSL